MLCRSIFTRSERTCGAEVLSKNIADFDTGALKDPIGLLYATSDKFVPRNPGRLDDDGKYSASPVVGHF